MTMSRDEDEVVKQSKFAADRQTCGRGVLASIKIGVSGWYPV